MRTLVITVGGSFEPVRTSIESLEPDRVVFLCSGGRSGSRSQVDGPGTPCEVRQLGQVVEKRPSLVHQLDLKDYEVETLEDPDDLPAWYALASGVLERLMSQEASEIQVDYTGGTKTMSAALVAAALDLQVPVFVTTGVRRDLVKVDFGQSTERLETHRIHAARALKIFLPDLLEAFDYSGAVSLMERLRIQGHSHGVQRAEFQFWWNLSRTLEAWDRFDHDTASRFLASLTRDPWIRDQFLNRLKNICTARADLETRGDADGSLPKAKSHHHGYEPVWDLILNAERRAAQSRFDDAVGRLYRALELTAQIRLQRTYGIYTVHVPPEVIPECVRPLLMEGKTPDPKTGCVRVGLFDSWRILSAFPDDPLGQRFDPLKGHLQTALEIRNHSLFAHGFQSINLDAWRGFHKLVSGFLADCIRDLTREELPAQLPGRLPELLLPQQ